jgi:hypothetical protein
MIIGGDMPGMLIKTIHLGYNEMTLSNVNKTEYTYSWLAPLPKKRSSHQGMQTTLQQEESTGRSRV